MKTWLNKRNELYSQMMEDEITNKHVVITHAILVGILLGCIIADMLTM